MLKLSVVCRRGRKTNRHSLHHLRRTGPARDGRRYSVGASSPNRAGAGHAWADSRRSWRRAGSRSPRDTNRRRRARQISGQGVRARIRPGRPAGAASRRPWRSSPKPWRAGVAKLARVLRVSLTEARSHPVSHGSHAFTVKMSRRHFCLSGRQARHAHPGSGGAAKNHR